MKLEPLGDRVLVEVLPLPQQSEGGVVLPESSRERSQRGLVLSVGPGRWDSGQLVPVMIEENDVVVFSKYGGTELPDGHSTLEKQLLILREADVLGIERKDDEPAEPAEACRVCHAAPGEPHDGAMHDDYAVTRPVPAGQSDEAF